MLSGSDPDTALGLRTLAAVDRACTVLTVAIAEAARRKGLPITIEHFFLLHALTLAPANTLEAGELAELACLPRSTISDTLQRLEAEGVVVRSTVGHDRRRVQATITVAGAALVEEWATEMHDIAERHIFGVLNEDHYASTLSATKAINSHERMGAFAAKHLVDIDGFTPFASTEPEEVTPHEPAGQPQ